MPRGQTERKRIAERGGHASHGSGRRGYSAVDQDDRRRSSQEGSRSGQGSRGRQGGYDYDEDEDRDRDRGYSASRSGGEDRSYDEHRSGGRSSGRRSR